MKQTTCGKQFEAANTKIRKPALLFIVILLTLSVSAQVELEQALRQAIGQSQQALKATERTAGHFGFLHGAYDRAEINRHLTDAREDLDSLRRHTREAAYQSSDAAYFAKTGSLEMPEQLAAEAKIFFQSVTRTLDEIVKKIDEFITHGTSNEDAYLNQRLEDFEQAKQQLHQAQQKLQQANKSVNTDRAD
nr:hypothetical protein [Sunxiuqinia sp.]